MATISRRQKVEINSKEIKPTVKKVPTSEGTSGIKVKGLLFVVWLV